MAENAELLKANRERMQLRRLFNRTAVTLQEKLQEGDFSAIEVDYLYLQEKMDRLKVLDEIIQQDYMAMTKFEEDLLTKEIDEAEDYVSRFIKFKQKYYELKPKEILTQVNLTTEAKEEKRNYKLPLIEIKKYDDDPKKWIQFWGQFKKIHEDRKITDEDKFQYLIQCLHEDSNARTLVESFPPSAENYPKAVEQLRSRYGREEMLVEVYIRELLSMVLAQAKGELVLDLRSLYDKISTYLYALETLKVTKDRYDAMLFPLIESAMPEQILIAWSRSQLQIKQEQQGSERLAQLLKFLNNEVEAEERIRLARAEFSQGSNMHLASTNCPTAACLTTKISKETCFFCDRDNHTPTECNRAAELSLDEKKELIKKKGGCYLCLKRGHVAKRCKSFIKCLACKRGHLVVLCPRLHGSEDKEVPQVKPNENVSLCQAKLTTLLQTLIAVVERGDKKKKVRILLDSGSQRSYIRKSLAEELNLQVIGQEEFGHTLFGGLETKPEVYSKCEFKVSSLDNSFGMTMQALALKNALCGYLPKVEDKKIMQKLQNLKVELSDKESDIIDIGILLGSDYMGAILTGTMVHVENNLCATKTKLGWTLQGPTTGAYSSMVIQTCFSQTNNITDLWNIELLGIKDPQEKIEQDEILKSFNDNISETETGRYEVNLLWKEDTPELKSNYDQAFKRLQTTSKKLMRTGNMQIYDEVFREWIEEGIIEEVKDDSKNKGHYLSHKPVFKMSSNTTKVRPVFDASMKDENGWSLNDCMDKGLNLIEFIPKLLILFRKSTYAITSDIKKAFLNISVKEEDRDYLKFLWWKNTERCEDVVTYRHQRLVFGLTCSPFILAAIIKYHLENIPEKYKETAHKLKDSFYVDNCVTSVESEEQMDKFIFESKELMDMGKFDLREWVTAPKRIDDTITVPVLGMTWNTIQDDLQCSVNLKHEIKDKITKRQLLSVTQQVFDPLGLVSPVTLIPKLITQKAWLSNTGWDQQIPEELKEDFMKWLSTLDFINECRFPRRLTNAPIETCDTSVHVMCDASKDAFAGCIFLRTRHGNQVNVQLVLAKSRVSPTKRKMSLPRLELMGALIASRLFIEVMNSGLLSDCKDYEVFCWTDSTVVLAWLKRQKSWKPFVSNRVSEICKNTKKENWYHLPGNANPADLPSRGCDAKYLMESRWWEGPQWLKLEKDEWPKSDINDIAIDEDAVYNEEMKKTATNVDTYSPDFSERLLYFSKYNKIVRLVAWLLRMNPTMRRRFSPRKEDIGNDEYKNAEQVLIRLVQKENLENKGNIPKNLCTIVDENGIIKVKTRLDFSNESKDFICPILLPGKCEIVERLVVHRHLMLNHAGTLTMMTDMRNTYWILNIRRLAKKIVARCITCKRYKCKTYSVPESPLPTDRTHAISVFQVSGIDLAGPLYLMDKQKCWIVLFTCATYRAIHLELVESLSTASFIMALRRFLARRGRVSVIYTDNGTNFLGTANMLKNIDWAKVESSTASRAIQWKFIPPGSPWWGGWWERIIRVVKEMLRRILGKSSVNWIELSTILCDCESVINSRPITYIAMNDDSLRPLTPQMFLQGISNCDTPDLDKIDAENLGQRYQFLQKLRQDFRQRFKNEYLSLLSSKRYKGQLKEPQVGDVVLVELDTTRLHWPLGVVIEIYIGNDGFTRVARVRTATGEKVRACQKLYPLELSADSLKEELLDTGKLDLSIEPAANPDTQEPASADSPYPIPVETRRGRVVRIPHIVRRRSRTACTSPLVIHRDPLDVGLSSVRESNCLLGCWTVAVPPAGCLTVLRRNAHAY